MDPRLYKTLIEDKPKMGSDGSGLGHIQRSAPAMPSPSPMPAPTQAPQMSLNGAPAPPVVAPNYSPPPFTAGAVLPHVSSQLGSVPAKQAKFAGTARRVGIGVGFGLLAYGVYAGARALATRAFESAGDDVMPDLED